MSYTSDITDLEEFVGLVGTGADVELEVVRETDRAYLLLEPYGKEIWLPKSVFDEEGVLKKFGLKLFHEKVES